MGRYIDKGNIGFREARRGEYVDKSGLISIINGMLCTEFKYSCVSCARRFGKSMAAKMLCAYYDRSCSSRELFQDLEIARDPSFEEHLNQYPVIYLDVTDFTSREAADTPEAMDKYVNLLRRLFKGGDSAQVFAGVYMTGILPIKKNRTESALTCDSRCR